MTNCTFSGNSADKGGGMYNVGSTPMLANCTFSNNWAGCYGGGMYNYDNSKLTLANCTFGGNSAVNGMAVACDSWGDPSTVVMANCVLWDGGNDIGNNDGSTITITYSDIQGGWPGEGCIDSDPAFVRDPDDGGDG